MSGETRFLATAIAFSMLGSTCAFASSPDNTPTALAALQARADQAPPTDRCFLYAQLVSRMTDLAGQQFDSGDSTHASETLKLVQRYAERIHAGIAINSKKQKNAELLIRRTSFRLKDMLGAVSYEDRQALEATLIKLNQVQAELMMQVFKQ